MDLIWYRFQNGSIALSEIAVLLLVVLAPLRYLFRTNHFGRAVLFMWGGFVFWSLLFCLIVPVGVFSLTGDEAVFEYYAEPAGIVGMLCISWVHSAFICFMARGVRRLWLQFLPSRAKTADGTARSN